MKALTFVILGCFTQPYSTQSDISVQHIKPSELIQKLRPIIGSEGGIDADDFRSTVRIYGSDEEIARIKKFIAMYDVKPKRVDLKWSLQQRVEKYELSGRVALRNGKMFTFSSDERDIKVKIVSSVVVDKEPNSFWFNTNVTITVGELEFTKLCESKSSVQFIVKVPEMKPRNERAEKALRSTDKRLWPEIALTVSLNEQ
jgi:hypothetical protein